MSSKKIDELDVMQDIDGLPDDLFLEDVGGDKPSKKYAGWVNSRSMGSRGRGRAKKHGGFNHGVKDELLDVGEHDLNSLENWDLDDELYAEMEGGVLKKPPFRSCSLRGRAALLKKTQLKSGVGQRPYRGKDYDSLKPPEDIFDIESKSREHKFNWNREGDYVQEESSWRSGESAEQDGDRSPSYVAHRKYPPRITRKLSEPAENKFGPSRNDPRLKTSNIPRTNTTDNVYAPARKDPRLVPQQALMHRPQSSKPDPHLDALRKNPRLSSEKNPAMDLAPPGVEELEEPMPSSKQEAVTRRGPRSPSPPSPLRISGDRSLSPSSRHDRPFRERNLSPRRRGIHRNSLSPHKREWPNSCRDSRSPSMRISTSPRRHQRPKEWSGSPRRDRNRDESQSGRRDRSLSPWGKRSPFSPSRHSSLSSSRDESWRQSPSIGSVLPHYGHVQQQPPPQQSYEVIGPPPPPPLTTATNVYNEGNYSGPAPTAPAYNAPQAPPPAYSNYQQYGYDSYYQQQPPPPQSYPGEYAPPAPQPPSWTDGGMVYPDVSQPPPVQIGSVSGTSGPAAVAGGSSQPPVDQKSEEAKKEAVKNEMIQQKQTLSKQREEYVRKKALITHELQLLREQEEDLLEENSRDNDRILKENNKLQLEIQNKLKAINNVIDMLTGIIGDKDQQDLKRISKAGHKDPDKKKPKTPPETPPQSSSESEEEDVEDAASKRLSRATCNFVYYDPEMHWCRVCDVFPRTAKEYLNHLHSIEHKEETMERKLVDMPWHKIQPDQEILHIPGAPTKRTPIRGLQFFISATAWYCKLCDTWIGDLHCASLHLKSKRHTENYSKFTEQNPHWETDWIADRQRAYEQYSEKLLRVKEENKQLPPVVEQTLVPSLFVYGKNIKPEQKEDKYEPKLKKIKSKDQRKKMKKNCLTALDETKKKKRHKKQKSKKLHGSFHEGRSSSSSSGSSSSSSSSEGDSEAENGDKSKSIRVVMRNKAKGVHEQQIPLLPRSRWDSPPEQKPEDVEEHDEKMKQSIDVSIGAGDDKLIREWMTSSKDVSDGEKQLLNSIKDRLKQKQEADKERERERRDDKRDSRRGRRRSDSPSSPSYRSKRSRSDKSPDDRRERSSRFDRYERYDSFHKSPERPARRDSSSKIDQKFKEEPDVKFSERKSDQEKKIMAKLEEEEEDDEESAESKFEKQTAEAAAKLMKKSKKPAVLAVPKSKLPFIGRMPILKHFAKKKKPEDNKSEGEESKQATEDPLVQAQYKLEFTNVGGKVHIGPQDSSTPKGSGVIGPEIQPSTAQSTEHEVQDMEIDEDTSNSDAPPPTIETPVVVDTETAVQTQSPKKPLNDIPLPKDFQDALNILFPGQESSEKKEDVCTPSSGVIQSGPKPPSMPPTNHQGHWPPGTGPTMMSPMQNFGGSSQMMGGGGPMMGPMHGMHGPTHPGMQGPPQGPQGMYGPPYGLHVQGPMMGPPHATNIMQKNEPPMRHPSLPPSKEKKTPPSKVGPSKKEIAVRKSDVAGEMSADELAMMGIDVGDMAAQSF